MCGLLAWAVGSHAQKSLSTPQSQMEKLDRGLVAFPTTAGKVFVSWRLLGTDTPGTAFTLLKNGTPVAENITGATSMSVDGTADDEFEVWAYDVHSDALVIRASETVKPWAKSYHSSSITADRRFGGYLFTQRLFRG